MRRTSRRDADQVVRPFIASNRERAWLFEPDLRLPPEHLDEGARTGSRTASAACGSTRRPSHSRSRSSLRGGYGAMIEMGFERYFRDASVYLHTDGTVDVSNFNIVKSPFPGTADNDAGPEQRDRHRHRAPLRRSSRGLGRVGFGRRRCDLGEQVVADEKELPAERRRRADER